MRTYLDQEVNSKVAAPISIFFPETALINRAQGQMKIRDTINDIMDIQDVFDGIHADTATIQNTDIYVDCLVVERS